jgi:transcriptional regulator with XRE-family HTH domain
MLTINRDVLDDVLRAMRRNQTWLAETMGLHRSYVSQCLNNRCKISVYFITQLLTITHIPFDVLFKYDSAPDNREFYGDLYVVGGKTMRLPEYKQAIVDRINS